MSLRPMIAASLLAVASVGAVEGPASADVNVASAWNQNTSFAWVA